MKDKISAKIAIALLIIIGMMPFNNVFAETPQANNVMTWAYSFVSNSQTSYMYCDLYFVSNRLVTNANVVITNNRVYRLPTSTSISFMILECDGITSLTRTNTDQGYNQMQQWDINLKDTTYMHARIVYQDTEANLRNVIANPQYYTAVQFFLNGNITYGLYEADLTTVINQIHNQMTLLLNNGLTLDMTTTNDLLQELIDLQTEQIQGNQDTEESIDNNIDINSDLQSEVNDYNDIETDLTTDFNNNLEDINVTEWKTRIQGWGSGVLWLKTQMNNMYTSLGDFKYLAEIGMILAIALIFIGR